MTARSAPRKPEKWITQLSDGKYQIRFFNKDGKERKLVRAARTEAEVAFLSQVGPMSRQYVGECRVFSLAMWFKHRQRERQVRTDADYEKLHRWFLPQYGDRLIADITIKDLAAFRTFLRDVPKPGEDEKARYSAKHVDNCIRTMRRMFRLAAEDGLLTNNPAAMLGGKPKTHGRRGPQRFVPKVETPTRDELADMRDNANPFVGAALAITAATALKTPELDAMTDEDVLLSRRAISITHEMVAGKRCLIEHPEARRVVPVSEECIATVIRALVVKRGPEFHNPRGAYLLPIAIHSKTFRSAALGTHHQRHDRAILPPHTPAQIANRAIIDWIDDDVGLKTIAHWLGRYRIHALYQRYRKYIARKSLHQQVTRMNRSIETLLRGRPPVNAKAP